MTMTDDMFYPYWAGKFSGFISSIVNYYELPEDIKEKANEMLAEYDKAQRSAMIDKDAILNSAKVLANLLEEKADDITLKQYRQLEEAIEAAFKIVEHRR